MTDKTQLPDEYEWNLYHDMDNRSYQDVEKIQKLTKALMDIENTAVCVSIADPVELLENIMKTVEDALTTKPK